MADNRQYIDDQGRMIEASIDNLREQMLRPLNKTSENVSILAEEVKELKKVIEKNSNDKNARAKIAEGLRGIMKEPQEELEKIVRHVEDIKERIKNQEDHSDKVEKEWSKFGKWQDKVYDKISFSERALTSLNKTIESFEPKITDLVSAANGMLNQLTNGIITVRDTGLTQIASTILEEIKIFNKADKTGFSAISDSSIKNLATILDKVQSKHFDRVVQAIERNSMPDGVGEKIGRLADAGLKKGSMYTHDISTGSLLTEMMNDIKRVGKLIHAQIKCVCKDKDKPGTDIDNLAKHFDDFGKTLITLTETSYVTESLIVQFREKMENKLKDEYESDKKKPKKNPSPVSEIANDAGSGSSKSLIEDIAENIDDVKVNAKADWLISRLFKSIERQFTDNSKNPKNKSIDEKVTIGAAADSLASQLRSRSGQLNLDKAIGINRGGDPRKALEVNIEEMIETGSLTQEMADQAYETLRHISKLDKVEKEQLIESFNKANLAANELARAIALNSTEIKAYQEAYQEALNESLTDVASFNKRVKLERNNMLNVLASLANNLNKFSTFMGNIQTLTSAINPSSYGMMPELKASNIFAAMKEFGKTGTEWTKEINAATYETMGMVGDNIKQLGTGIVTEFKDFSKNVLQQLNPIGQAATSDGFTPSQQKYVGGFQMSATDLDTLFHDIGVNLVDIYRQTGQTAEVFRKQILGNLKRGITDYTTLNRVTKLGLSLGKVIGANAEQTADEFADWNQFLNMTPDQLDSIARRTMMIGRLTGVSGDNLLNAVKAARQFAEAMRNAGTLTGEAASKLIQLSTAAKKLGVEKSVNSLTEGLTSPTALMTRVNEKTRALLFQAAGISGRMNELFNGTILNNKKATDDMVTGLESIFTRMTGGYTIENADSIPEELKTQISLMLENLSGMELGEFVQTVRALREGNMNATEKLAGIDKKLSGTLSTSDRSVLQAQREQTISLIQKEKFQEVAMKGDKIYQRIQREAGADKGKASGIIMEELKGKAGTQTYIEAIKQELTSAMTNIKEPVFDPKNKGNISEELLFKENSKLFTDSRSQLNVALDKLNQLSIMAATGNVDPQVFLDTMNLAREAQGGLVEVTEKLNNRDVFTRLESLANNENLRLQRDIETNTRKIAEGTGADNILSVAKSASLVDNMILVANNIAKMLFALTAIQTAMLLGAGGLIPGMKSTAGNLWGMAKGSGGTNLRGGVRVGGAALLGYNMISGGPDKAITGGFENDSSKLGYAAGTGLALGGPVGMVIGTTVSLFYQLNKATSDLTEQIKRGADINSQISQVYEKRKNKIFMETEREDSFAVEDKLTKEKKEIADAEKNLDKLQKELKAIRTNTDFSLDFSNWFGGDGDDILEDQIKNLQNIIGKRRETVSGLETRLTQSQGQDYMNLVPKVIFDTLKDTQKEALKVYFMDFAKGMKPDKNEFNKIFAGTGVDFSFMENSYEKQKKDRDRMVTLQKSGDKNSPELLALQKRFAIRGATEDQEDYTARTRFGVSNGTLEGYGMNRNDFIRQAETAELLKFQMKGKPGLEDKLKQNPAYLIMEIERLRSQRDQNKFNEVYRNLDEGMKIALNDIGLSFEKMMSMSETQLIKTLSATKTDGLNQDQLVAFNKLKESANSASGFPLDSRITEYSKLLAAAGYKGQTLDSILKEVEIIRKQQAESIINDMGFDAEFKEPVMRAYESMEGQIGTLDFQNQTMDVVKYMKDLKEAQSYVTPEVFQSAGYRGTPDLAGMDRAHIIELLKDKSLNQNDPKLTALRMRLEDTNLGGNKVYDTIKDLKLRQDSTKFTALVQSNPELMKSLRYKFQMTQDKLLESLTDPEFLVNNLTDIRSTLNPNQAKIFDNAKEALIQIENKLPMRTGVTSRSLKIKPIEKSVSSGFVGPMMPETSSPMQQPQTEDWIAKQKKQKSDTLKEFKDLILKSTFKSPEAKNDAIFQLSKINSPEQINPNINKLLGLIKIENQNETKQKLSELEQKTNMDYQQTINSPLEELQSRLEIRHNVNEDMSANLAKLIMDRAANSNIDIKQATDQILKEYNTPQQPGGVQSLPNQIAQPSGYINQPNGLPPLFPISPQQKTPPMIPTNMPSPQPANMQSSWLENSGITSGVASSAAAMPDDYVAIINRIKQEQIAKNTVENKAEQSNQHLDSIEGNTEETAAEMRKLREVMEKFLAFISGSGSSDKVTRLNNGRTIEGAPANYYEMNASINNNPSMGGTTVT